MIVRLALAMALLAPGTALAHPHVLIDAHAVVMFEKGKIAFLQMGWKFDPVYSSSLVADFDKDKNKALSPAEIAAIERDAFADTIGQGYFTHAKVDGKPVTWPKATNFTVGVVKDALVYSFRLALPQPVDPRRQRFQVSTFEETYYIDIDIADDEAFVLAGDGSGGCRVVRGEDRDNPLLGGVAFPRKVEVTCAP